MFLPVLSFQAAHEAMAKEVGWRDQRNQEQVAGWEGLHRGYGSGGTLQRTLGLHESMELGPKVGECQGREVERS